jgi:hypothetical protein
MKFSKDSKGPRWISSLFSVFDESKGNCAGDLLEEYDELIESKGRLRAIKWLSGQVTVSLSYLTRGRNWGASWWSMTRSLIVASLRGLRSRVAFSSPRLRSSWLYACTLLLALGLTISYLHLTRQTNANLEAELASLNDSVDSRTPNVLLRPTLMLRSSEQSLTRIEIDHSAATVCFHIQLPPDATMAAYNVRLNQVDVGDLFVVKGLKRVEGNVVSLTVPTKLIAEGDYLLTVLIEDIPLQDYVFRASRKGVPPQAK